MDVTWELDDRYVATITLHRPPNNYFDQELVASIADALEQADTEGARAAVLAAEGKHFCAGAMLTKPSAASARHLYDEAARLFASPLPMVAAVNGAAIGGGLGLALAADFRVASPESRFSANFAQLGFHHGFALTVTLPAAVGTQRAHELLLTGARIDGIKAYDMGLVDRLVPTTQLADEAHAFAAAIASAAPLAVRSIRHTMRADLLERVTSAMAHERAEQDRLTRTADFAEGVRATAERRPPKFLGT